MAENIVKRKEEVCEEEILNLTGTKRQAHAYP
jgi:DNA polymerase III delta prime subunit